MIAHSWRRAAAGRIAALMVAGCGLVGCTQDELPGGAECEEGDSTCRQEQGLRGCICPDVYAPVCGKDGKTYGNSCEASCAGVRVAHDGECGDAGCGAETCRSNADCARGTICDPSSGQCRPECTIACLVYEPVCGTDGVTYGCGAADAHCHGAEVAYQGECGSACNDDEDCPHGYCDRGVTCAAIGCPPPPPNKCTVCGDGSQLICRSLPLPCPDGQVREIIAGCYGECVDRFECAAAPGTCSYEGQRYRAGESFPASDGCNTCSCGADGLVACTLKACVCDYSDPARRWVARSAEQCKAVKFACDEGQRQFFDSCGCGCEAEPGCSVGGCSGQLCVGPGEPSGSTCEWRPEYACYRSASCEAQADGRCGWTPSDELRRCIEAARSTP